MDENAGITVLEGMPLVTERELAQLYTSCRDSKGSPSRHKAGVTASCAVATDLGNA